VEGWLTGFGAEPDVEERSEGSTGTRVPEPGFGRKDQRGWEMPNAGTRPYDFRSHSF